MNVRLLSAYLLTLGAATAFAAPPREKVMVDPNDPQKTRPIVSREEREKLGLKPHTWTGVVDSEVSATLDRMDKTVAGLKDKMKSERDVKAFNTLWRIRFKSMVYVEVQTKDKDAQHRVLASLKASEFHAPCPFETAAGLTGYVNKEGLEKLSKHPDVTGVCVDDKPLPTKGMTIFKDNLPPLQPGEKSSEQPGVAEQKVDPNVYRAFALSDRVDVAISLLTESLPKLTDVRSEMHARNELRSKAEKELQDRVLSTVNADELWVDGRLGPSLSGRISNGGLQKLWKHPDVKRVYVQQLSKIPEDRLKPR